MSSITSKVIYVIIVKKTCARMNMNKRSLDTLKLYNLRFRERINLNALK